jgi:hypothetical protein
VTDPEVRTLGQFVRENAGRVSVHAGLFAGATYVVVRLAVGTFYSGFGLSPEEVGIDQTAIVSRSGGVALLSLIIIGLLVFLIALLGDLPRMHRERNDKPTRSEIAIVALSFGGALTFALFQPLGIALLGAAALIMLGGGIVRGAVSIWRTPMTAWRPRVAIACLLVVTAT